MKNSLIVFAIFTLAFVGCKKDNSSSTVNWASPLEGTYISTNNYSYGPNNYVRTTYFTVVPVDNNKIKLSVRSVDGGWIRTLNYCYDSITLNTATNFVFSEHDSCWSAGGGFGLPAIGSGNGSFTSNSLTIDWDEFTIGWDTVHYSMIATKP